MIKFCIFHENWMEGSGPRSRWIESCARLQEEITFICTREQRGPVLDTSLKSKANTFAVAHTRARTHNLLLYPKSQSRGWNPFLRGFSLRLFYIYIYLTVPMLCSGESGGKYWEARTKVEMMESEHLSEYEMDQFLIVHGNGGNFFDGMHLRCGIKTAKNPLPHFITCWVH